MTNVEEEVLICALRYALGRHTYIVSVIADNVKNNINKLSQKTIGVMAKDIQEVIKEGEPELATNKMDYSTWKKLLSTLFGVMTQETKKWFEDNTGEKVI